MKIVPLKADHFEDAAGLVSSQYKTLYERVPHLPDRYKDANTFLPLLRNIMDNTRPGVAAIQDGQLVGHLIGWLMPNFRGKMSVYSPEWANAATIENCAHIYQEMYRQIAANWVADKYAAHYISIFAHDREAIRTWHWLGFGMLGVDAVRGLQPIKGINKQIEIRRANPHHIEQVLDLQQGLVQFVKESPYFFIGDDLNRAYFEEWLQEPDKVIWLAYVDDEPVTFIRMGPANDDASTIIMDEGTTSIYGAFTQEKMRDKNIATSVLAHAVGAARSQGYERWAVDFESMNLLGTRFWLGHDFVPVCYSLQRNVDERVL